MAEEYISSYLAEKLKLYGYPVKYEIQGKFGLTEVKKVIKRIKINDVLDWFRNEKGIFIPINIKYSYNDVNNMPLKEPYLVGFYYGIYRLEKNSTDNIKVHEIETHDLNFYKTYEEAAVNGIIYLLEKLNF
jgi:hypothetical protein